MKNLKINMKYIMTRQIAEMLGAQPALYTSAYSQINLYEKKSNLNWNALSMRLNIYLVIIFGKHARYMV